MEFFCWACGKQLSEKEGAICDECKKKNDKHDEPHTAHVNIRKKTSSKAKPKRKVKKIKGCECK